ncbi:MAG: hypothetical protein RLZZ126_328 [Pseudomonadota bacterium]|jgi:threo-3-hydroxy-L-aspartate ammonia-lyase
MFSDKLSLPTITDVQTAARRLQGVAHRTPVLTSRTANELMGAEVFFKCENLQRMGAFKFRGAYNAMAALDAAQRQAGVVCFSSGNHAQAVALSGQLLGVATVILMPQDAPPLKLSAVRQYAAGNAALGVTGPSEVILYDRFKDDREAMMEHLARERGLTRIPPYDHFDVVAGQGTAALELLQDVGPLDALYVCLGGGGFLAGSAVVAKGLHPAMAVYGVEPLAGNDAQQSLAAGHVVRIDTPQTIADGAQTQSIGEINFALISKTVDAVRTVTDAALVDAMHFFAERMKMIVEPTGALAWAGALADGASGASGAAAALRGKRIGVMISGGNVDLGTFSRLMAERQQSRDKV